MNLFQETLNHLDRRTTWNKHREQVTKLFDEPFMEKGIDNKIAIFGAGYCDDLDLDQIAAKCGTIYLFIYLFI